MKGVIDYEQYLEFYSKTKRQPMQLTKEMVYQGMPIMPTELCLGPFEAFKGGSRAVHVDGIAEVKP